MKQVRTSTKNPVRDIQVSISMGWFYVFKQLSGATKLECIGISNTGILSYSVSYSGAKNEVNNHSTAYLPRYDPCSACSTSQNKREFTDLCQSCWDNPLDILAGLWKNQRKDKHCQDKL